MDDTTEDMLEKVLEETEESEKEDLTDTESHGDLDIIEEREEDVEEKVEEKVDEKVDEKVEEKPTPIPSSPNKKHMSAFATLEFMGFGKAASKVRQKVCTKADI